MRFLSKDIGDPDPEVARWMVIIRRHFALVVLVTLAVTGLVTAFGLSRPATYKATASVLVQQPLTDTANIAPGATDIDNDVKLANSDVLLQAVKERLGAHRHFAYHAVGSGRVISFVATARHPREAADAANASADGFLALRDAALTSQYDKAQRSLNDAIASLDSRIAATSDPALVKILTGQRADYRNALNRLLVQSELATSGDTEQFGQATAPTKPQSKLALYVAIGALAGFLLALVLAMVIEQNNDTIESVQGLGDALVGDGGAGALLAQVPAASRSKRWPLRSNQATVSVASPASARGDAYAMLRSALLHQLDQPVLVVASAARDGDHLDVGMNLAASFGRAGYRTLVVSADLRSPETADVTLAGADGDHRALSTAPTLSAILLGAASLDDLDGRPPVMENLWHVPAGNRASAISLVDLDVNVMVAAVDSMRAMFDAVVILGPAVTLYPDTGVLARVSDGLLLATTARVTHAADVSATSRLIRQVGGQLLGAVLTGGRAAREGRHPAPSVTAVRSDERRRRLDLAAGSDGEAAAPRRRVKARPARTYPNRTVARKHSPGGAR